MSPRVTAFPWNRVPRLERAVLEARRELALRLEAALDPARLVQALEQLIGDDVRASFEWDGLGSGDDGAGATGTSSTLRFPGLGLRLEVTPEADLVRAAVAILLEQDFELGWADTGVDPPLRGAGAALVLETARRAARSEAPELVLAPAMAEPPAAAADLAGNCTLWLADRPYRLGVRVVAMPPERRRAPRPAARLGRLGDVRLSVPWVGAVSSIALTDLAGLGIGDVWVAGAGAWLGGGDAGPSAGVLAPPRAERGLPVRAVGGRIMLGAGAVRVHEELESSMGQEESELEQIVGETPLVVRLEVGALEMTAAEWAALRPGDVVQSGRRIEDPVILRAGGREIARGELVDIEGEIGVRITQIGSAGVAP